MQETLTIGTFVLGMTQLVKDTKLVEGEWLKIIALVLGGFATVTSLYYPELWEQLSAILLAVGVTGGVSFVNEQRSK